MKPSVSVQAANADVNRVMSGVARQNPTHFGGYTHSLVQSASGVIVGPVTTMLWLLYAAVFTLLIIACANVTNLSLVRAASREREFVVRSALGASTGRIASQLCTESALIALAAGILGVVLATQELRAFAVFGAAILPRWESVRIDAGVLGYTAGLLILVAIAVGLLPAFFSRRDLCSGLKDAGRSGDNSAGRRVRAALIVAEIALALAVATSAGLIVRSYVALTKVDIGFNAANAYIFRVPGLPPTRYADKTARLAAVERILKAVRAIPGVTGVTVSAVVPFRGEFNVGTSIPSIPSFHDNIDGNAITPGYFKAFQIALLRGRDFNDFDRANSQPVAIVSASFARRFFGSVDGAMRAKITPGLSDSDTIPPRIIVGVVADTRNSLSAPPDEEMYVPQTQFESNSIVFVRTDGRSSGLSAAIARGVSSVDPLFAPPKLTPYSDMIASDAERSAAAAALFALLAIVAVILALAGVYSVTAFSMAQRTHEFGIRKAIGARDRDVILTVLATTLRQSIIGVAIGVALAASAARILSTMLFQTSALDPATFTFVCALLIVCSTAGALLPATKSVTVDPSRALRYE
jgi:putative ABC transport system permease protein